MNTLLFAAFFVTVPGQAELRVTFYENSGLGQDFRTRTFAEAERILRVAGVNVVWTEGDPTNSEARLIQYPERPRKEEESHAACRARSDIALELLPHAPEGVKETVLGVAQPFATAGLNVRLFMNRIEATALSVRQSAAVLAGHVLAHEISHVLLRSHEHWNAGLMAGVWGIHEYSRMLSGTLLLSRVQAERIRSSLNRTACPSPSDNRLQKRHATVAASEAQNGRKLRVFVTDRAGTWPLVVLAAVPHAARLLAAAGVETTWKLCEASTQLPGREPCFQPGALSIAVRLLPSRKAKLWSIERSSCGMALAGAPGEHWVLAIIDAGCISRITGSASQALAAAALGHVIAHEVGHLLLGKDSHSPSGLMSAEWTEAEQRLLVRGELNFTADDAAALRDAIARRAK